MKLHVAVLLLAIAGSNSIHSKTFDFNANEVNKVDTIRRNNLPAVNINYMLRGHFFAASPGVPALDGVGGWGGSDNPYRKFDGSLPVNRAHFEVYIDNSTTVDLGNGNAAFNVYVINATDDTLFFEAQDSRLHMVMEAKDGTGTWKPIEYLPNSWCGNSYHTMHLPTGTYWKFKTPVFEGRFNTSLRISLTYRTDPNGKEETAYSNEIKGSINPGQFSQKKKYEPNGIMDPYLE